MRRALAVLGVLAMACGPRPASDTGPGDLLDAESEAPPAAVDAPEDADAEAPPAAVREVDRADLAPVLNAGPGAFLAGIELEPAFADQRWRGWRIVSFYPDDPRYRGVDVRPGDIVRSVNGVVLKRPEQLFEVWTGLRRADAIEVAGWRGGEPLALRIAIIGPPLPAPPQK